mgnify:CR=1 FL=1
MHHLLPCACCCQHEYAAIRPPLRQTSLLGACVADNTLSCLLAVLQVLIADFFFVLAVLGWLGAGLAGKAMGSSALIDAWMPLWPMVFQPAIGILMAGALVSGGLNWLAEQQQQKS